MEGSAKFARLFNNADLGGCCRTFFDLPNSLDDTKDESTELLNVLGYLPFWDGN